MIRVQTPADLNCTTRCFARRASDVFLCNADEAVAVSKYRTASHWALGYGICCLLALLAAAVMVFVK